MTVASKSSTDFPQGGVNDETTKNRDAFLLGPAVGHHRHGDGTQPGGAGAGVYCAACGHRSGPWGFDPGAIGMDTKVEECEINLAIAKLLKAELEQRGYRVLMTREEDKALAQTKKADMQARRDMIGQSGRIWC